MFQIAWMTYREILRDKLYYVSLFLALLLLILSVLASNLTIGRPERVILNFGLSGFGIATTLMAILFGASLLQKEMERRTILVILSKPISPAGFLIGKWMGLALTLTLNAIFLAISFWGLFTLLGGHAQATWLAAMLLLFLQSLLMATLALSISVFTSRTFSILAAIALYLVGNNSSQINRLAEKAPLLKIYYWLLPNLENFNLGWLATYQLPVSPSVLFWAYAYFVFYATFCLLLGCVGFSIKGVSA